MTFKESKQRKVARILVNLNIREGLGKEFDLSWGGYTYNQKLDYKNIPFRCRRCHQYGHLIKSCKLPVRTRGYSIQFGQRVFTKLSSCCAFLRRLSEGTRMSNGFSTGTLDFGAHRPLFRTCFFYKTKSSETCQGWIVYTCFCEYLLLLCCPHYYFN
jgi:hypothetical protein